MSKEVLLAFKNTTITKEELLDELNNHQKLDNFVRGTFDNGNGKGCAVGCSLQSLSKIKGVEISYEDHLLYEKHFGVPEWLARVEDALFEGVGVKRSKTFPVEFIQAINPGADLNKIKNEFVIYILKSNLKNFDHKEYPDVKKAIDMCVALYEAPEWDESAAESARLAARLAARSIAYEDFADELLELIKKCK